ncbi:MAG: YbjN domain-containing protein, partial [Nitriliruptoraceae bacterium]
MTPDVGAEWIETALDGLGLDVQRVGDAAWLTVLEGEHKRTLPVYLELRERNLHVTAFVAGALDEGHAGVYAQLLARNQRAGPVHFALDDDGDVVLVGQVPREALDDDVLDEVLGRVLVLADDAFDAVLRTGFASYLETEQR